MDTPKRRARVPARMTIQVSDDLKGKLNHLAQEEYGGDLQALIRETLQVRVDGSVSDTDLVRGLQKDVKEIDKEINRRHEDLRGGILQLLDIATHLAESAGVHQADIAALSEYWLEVKRVLDNQAQLIAKVAAQVQSQNDTLTMLAGHIRRQNEVMEQHPESADKETRGKRKSFLGF